ncbi:MAG: hypothetical protein JWR26_1065 [Pedosphaera sp.]|nr:hypothetical protein [Pedosphaera sp.]
MPNYRLEQKIFSKGTQSFELREDEDHVRVTTRRGGSLSEYKVPIEVLSPEPNRFKRLDIQMLVGTVIFGCLAVAFIIPAYKTQEWGYLWVTFFLALPAIACGYKFKLQSQASSIFYSKESGNVALVLWDANPTQAAFDEFCRALNERVRKMEVKFSSRNGLSAADELRKLGDLRKDGILSESEFAAAKAKILDSFEKRSIGFKPD